MITTSITWPATANVIVHCGATPVFADVRDDDLNVDPERVRELVGPQTRAILPVRPLRAAGRPRPAARARPAARRGRRARVRVALPRPQGRLDRRPDLLLALRDEERRRRRGRAARDERRRRCGGGRRPARDAPRPRLALRHRCSRLQGEPPDVLARSRSCSSTSSTVIPRSASGTSPPTTRRSRDFDGIEPVARTGATPTRSISTSSASTPSVGRARDEYQRALTEENIGTSIHFLPVHRSRPTATGFRRASRRCRRPSGRARRCFRCRSRRRTRTTTSATRSTPCGACTSASG